MKHIGGLPIPDPKMMKALNRIPFLLLTLRFTFTFLGCADTPTEPELTEEDVTRIVAEAMATLNW